MSRSARRRPVHGGRDGSLQPLEAVLFDMDGTLVETEELWGEALSALAEQLGGVLSADARGRTVGTSMTVAMGILYEDLDIARTAQELTDDARWVEDETASLMSSRGVPWRPGAQELLTAVRDAGVATALVTTTARRIATIVLDRFTAELGHPPFDVTVCGDEVPARKPDPAPYRQAMAALGVDPGSSVVVEDSAVGVTAGLAAGVVVLGVPSLQSLDPRPGLVLRESLAGLTVADLEDLLGAGEAVELPA